MLVQFVTLVFLAFLIYFIRRMALGSIVAARFLSLIAHFVITVTIFWSRVSTICKVRCDCGLCIYES